MKNSACKSLFCVMTLALSSCAGFSSTDNTVAPSIDAPATETMSMASNTADANSFSEELMKAGPSASVGINLTASSGRNVIEIDPGTTVPYKVSRLSAPDRLVLDLPGVHVAKSSTLTPSSQEIISSVRVGDREGSGRIVLDLTQPVKDSIREDGNKIVVSLATAADPAIAENTVIAPATAPIDTIETASALPNGPRLTGLNIEALPGQGNAIVADISSLKHFEFKKTAPSEYVANIPGASLDPAVDQTILAAPHSGEIRSVRPVSKNGDLVLRVFAQPQSELVASASGNRLVIKSAANTPDYMAQEKVEPSLPSAPEEKKDTTVAAKPSVDAPKKEEVTVKNSGGAIGNDDLAALLGGEQKYSGRLISLDLQDTDIDNALRIIAEVSNLNIIASSDVQGKVTLRLIDVPWDQALDVILKTNGLDKVQEGNVVRIAPVEKLRLERESLKQAQLAEEELEPLSVKYVRVSYARAADLQPLIKSVLTERGDVSVDERSNQLIVKDIHKGLKNAVDLISKLDLRTPQVLLETQIVEATRSLLRDLGSQLGFSYIQSPETGNATGFNFPNSIKIGGGLPNSSSASAFPAAVSGTEGSALSMVFGSADGTRSLDANISALEREGRVRIVSRPSVATTNNKTAEITSNETISVRKPNGGSNTVVGGSGGIGGGESATEKIKAGITLKVTPQASPDYYVLLDIIAESSTLGSKEVDGIPSVIERKATSTVLVSSGQTFAIGGIYRLIDQDTVSGVPFFKDIPVLGHFFGRTKVDNSDEELLFFITPRIIEGSFDDAAMSANSL